MNVKLDLVGRMAGGQESGVCQRLEDVRDNAEDRWRLEVCWGQESGCVERETVSHEGDQCGSCSVKVTA